MTDILDKFSHLLREAEAVVEVEVPFTVSDKITHKLTIHKGRAKNFRSIGNQFMEVDYQRHSATLVTSDDNGAGKSTMLVWLLFFVLYNDTYSKKEKKAGLVNSQNRKECVGEVEFSCRGGMWKVRRGIKPDFVEVWQMLDGKWMQVTNDAAKADMNKYIVSLIGVDQKMFENSLVLGKEKYIPFTEMYAADRRAMVETIWDLGVFSHMNEDVKSAMKKTNTELTDIDNQMGMLVIEHTNKKTLLEQINSSNAAIQQQSADVLEDEKRRLIALDEEISAEVESYETHIDNAMRVGKEISGVEDSLNTESLADIEKVKVEYSAKMSAVNDVAEEKAQDYQMIEVAEANKALSAAKEVVTVLEGEKSAILELRSQNSNELASALQRSRQGQDFRIKFQTEMEGHQAAIDRFHDMGTCPTCNQIVSEEAKAETESAGLVLINAVKEKLAQVDQAISSVGELVDDHQKRDTELAAQIVEVDSKLSAARAECNTISLSIDSLNRDIEDFYKYARVEQESLKREMQSKIMSLREALNTRFEDVTASLQKSRQMSSDSAKASGERITELRGRRTNLVSSISILEQKLSVQPTPTTELENTISEMETKMSEVADKQLAANERLQDLQHLLYFLKDDQTKSRIVALYLPYLNSKINEYMEALNMFLGIVVDDTFEITMSAAGRKGQGIFSLSTGQRARLNLAITLALRDVANLKASVQCNLFVLDEILENMSERGVQESVEMLKYKFGGNNLFVISQREQEFQEYFPHNIRYGLRNGLTEVISKE